MEDKLAYQSIGNGIISPDISRDDVVVSGGVYTSQFHLMEGTNLHRLSDNINSTYLEKLSEICKSKDKVIYLGLYISCWGHCITDNLKYLWFIKSEYYKSFFSDYKLVYTSREWANYNMSDNVKEILRILGIDDAKMVHVKEPTVFSEIILPDESFFNTVDRRRVCTAEYKDTIKSIREYGLRHKINVHNDKFFFLRANNNRYVDGEEIIADFFRDQGYTIVRPETLSFKAQLNILVQCRSFAACVGSTAHNIIFMDDGAEAILIPRNEFNNEYQNVIDNMMKNSILIEYINSSWSLYADENHNACYVISDELMNRFHLTDKQKQKYRWRSVSKFDSYIRYCIYRGLGLGNTSDEYYNSVMSEFQEYKRKCNSMMRIKHYWIVGYLDRIIYRKKRIFNTILNKLRVEIHTRENGYMK